MPIFVIFLIFFGVTWIITPVNFVVIYLRRKRARILAIKQRTAAAGAGMNLRRVGGEDGSLSEALMPRQLTAGAKCMFHVICIPCGNIHSPYQERRALGIYCIIFCYDINVRDCSFQLHRFS